MISLGIDIGTTSISIVVFDTTSDADIEKVTIPSESFIASDHPWEKIQDIALVEKKVFHAADELISRYPQIRRIGLTGQMHGIVYTDGSGQCISPLFTWQDERAGLNEFNGDSISSLIRKETGLNVPAGYGAGTHLYNVMKKIVPEGAAKICTGPDYIGMRLTGRKTPLVHSSMAASLGFFDINNKVFLRDLFSFFGNPEILPETTDRLTCIGEYRNIPVAIAIGDNQASFLGTVGEKQNTALINIGTGGQISALSDIPYETSGIEARPFIHDKFLLVGSSLCGGRSYAILENFFRNFVKAAGYPDEKQYAVMEKLAREGRKSSSSLTVDTRFCGTRTDASLTGSVTNIREDNFTPANLVYGFLTGIVKELHDYFLLICNGSHEKYTALAASGNGIRRNKILQEIAAEQFALPVKLIQREEEAACGAAIAAEKAVK